MPKRTASGMGIGLFQILTDQPSGDPAIIAQRAEELGFASYWVPEHSVIPRGSCDDYPAKEEGQPPPEYLFKMPDPYIALMRAASFTSEIMLGTGISLIAERNPLLAAKQIASLDHYSGGRVLFGIGGGWNEPECTVMGGDFDHRWAQTKEHVAAMKALWTGEYVEFHGKYVDFPPVLCLPRPSRQPHPPVYLGSTGSPRVFKRVAEWGDGWLPFTGDPHEIADGKAEIAKYAKALGRDPDAIDITLFAVDGLFRRAAELTEVAAAGADNVVLWLTGHNESEILVELDELAAAVF
ncbi:MAG: LLM class F420-dependent oxidoreductase [Proteobacteria bacterium]|nr:MAG: LLM class F420-dependent oxidoreductase [Pseudomonadota bacterium]